jgi:phage replication-related protein YjqB (UPF0714/DUF867 family)
MADKYPDFATLSRHEVSGIDYRIPGRRAKTSRAIVAVHGGGGGAGTSARRCCQAPPKKKLQLWLTFVTSDAV